MDTSNTRFSKLQRSNIVVRVSHNVYKKIKITGNNDVNDSYDKQIVLMRFLKRRR